MAEAGAGLEVEGGVEVERGRGVGGASMRLDGASPVRRHEPALGRSARPQHVTQAASGS